MKSYALMPLRDMGITIPWTAHPMAFKPCRCFTDANTKALIAKMDPLVAAAFHNQNCSALCRLPEELLLDVMAHLSLLRIQCLRRTCRLFLRLYCSPEHASTHDLIFKDGRAFLPWEQPKAGTWIPKQLPPLLDKDSDEYCRGCRSVRRSASGKAATAGATAEYAHCSGCRIDHPVYLFSITQRASPAEKRICIGREGHIRLCDHEVLRWVDVAQSVSELKDCKAGTDRQVVLATCQHESHVPQDGTHACAPTDNLTHPTAILYKTEQGGIMFETRWLGHLPVSDPAHGEVDRTEQATPSFIRERLEELRVGAAEFIAPEVPPGRLVEMNCFDPNRCACLRYSGLEHLSQSWQLTPLQEIRGVTCRSEPHLRLAALGTPTTGGEMPVHKGFAQSPQTSHHTDVQTTSSQVAGGGAIRITVYRCRLDPSRCLRIVYQRGHSIMQRWLDPRHLPMAWYQALDPDSYDLIDDHSFYGALWCRTMGCRNYYRYLKHILCSQRDSRRACGKYCPC